MGTVVGLLMLSFGTQLNTPIMVQYLLPEGILIDPVEQRKVYSIYYIATLVLP